MGHVGMYRGCRREFKGQYGVFKVMIHRWHIKL